ncbi:hypothetical protein PRK78_005493 [Emydomyces testavorans]|uniref:Uncharacterized protein n=1 Tax=Emydomyces testavorans TaxID=2070801 RepID=A0AAF0IKS3_9EURO|nr:hypothetical protein PRK78_005493 [Emydomyces testavorans]
MEESADHADEPHLQHPTPALVASAALRARTTTTTTATSSSNTRVPSPDPPSITTGTVTPDLHGAHELPALHEIPTHTRRDSSPSTISSGSIRIVTRRSTRDTQLSRRSSREPTGRFRHVIKFWRRNVVLSVSHEQNRDHYEG